MSPEITTRIVIGVVCFLLGVVCMWPPNGALLVTIFLDAYERWECPAVNDTACKEAGLDFEVPASPP